MKYFLTILSLALCNFVFAQRISKVTINGSGVVEKISIQTNDAVINLGLDGTIINYGVEFASDRNSNYTKIEPYQGRIDMFTNYDDAAFQGKVKYLGQTAITYYASYDDESLRGKVKTIGGLSIDYYMKYDDEAYRGKIKAIGNNALGYFSNFDNVALKGKLRSLGPTTLNYYSSFDDKIYGGKIKSIGQSTFTYYSSFDSRYAGAMKTGAQYQTINGIMFFVNQ